MDPAAIPTDSLYKFLALAGMVLNIWALHLYFSRRSRLLDRVAEIEIEAAELSVDVSDARERLTAAMNAPGHSASEFLQQTALVVDVERRHAGQAARVKALKHLAGEQRLLLWLLIVFLVVGTALASSGFYLWYDRLQRFQDRAVRAGRT